MRRDLLRLWQEWKRRWERLFPASERGTEQGAAFRQLDKLRWWVIPAAVLVFALLACVQMMSATSQSPFSYTPVIFDAPLPDPLRWQIGSNKAGRYFQLQRDPRDNSLIAREPAKGTRAFRGEDAVPIFGGASTSAEILMAACQDQLPQDAVVFYTADGLALWPCQDRREDTRVELHRIGWRLPRWRWERGLSLGYSATNDIVLGAALLPARALSLQLKNGQLHITSWEVQQDLPEHQRLVCLHHASDKVTADCPQKAIALTPGQRFRVYAKNHPEHAVTLLWRTSQQERGMFDLRLEPINGNGLSVRQLPLPPDRAGQEARYTVGNAQLYFAGHLPDTVRTLDLSEQVHELVLRNILLYMAPSQLRERLQRRHNPTQSLERLAQEAPYIALQPHLGVLYHNRYLRNRIWMANHSLAQRYRLQARSMFRIRFGGANQPAGLLGLGVGGATLQAPRRNLLQFSRSQRQTTVDIRLRTVLTAHQPGSAYFIPLDNREQPTYDAFHFVDQQPLELLTATTPPAFAADRDWHPVKAATRARTLLWVGENLYRSHQPLAYQKQITPQPTAQNKAAQPTRFLYHVRSKWWQRTKTLQRSSRDWPISAIAKELGTLLTQEKLTAALKELNPKRWSQRKHCGNESKKVGARWRHRSRCWGTTELFQRGLAVLVPCSPLVKSRLRERYCRPGQPTPKLDTKGRLVRRALTSIQGLYGVVVLPYEGNSQLTVSLGSRAQRKGGGKARHAVRLLPGSSPVSLDGQPIKRNMAYLLRDGMILQLGVKKLRYRSPDGTLALARFRREYIVPHYPEGPIFSHVIAGSVGGPFRTSPRQLREQLPPATTSSPAGSHTTPASSTQARKPQSSKARKIATSLQPDVQRIAFAVTRRHLARLDSPAFQKLFRRRYITNLHKPHAGAVVIMDRSNGRILASLSFPAFNPNLPQEPDTTNQQTSQYLQGQVVDKHGITDALLAYDPTHLPPLRPKRKELQGQPSPIPHYLEAVAWDREEERNTKRGDSRSGWLLERAFGGAQTPGSTAKIVTAIAYAKYLRSQGKLVQFPKHHCSGGLMFMRQRKHRDGRQSWHPSTIRFRCHKREGHGHLTLKQAMASSCNVYFAKLALEMAGVPASLLRKGKVQWQKNRYGRSGKYQSLQIPRQTISEAMARNPIHRSLFRTAAQLGFTMRYGYKLLQRKGAYGRYTDIFWESGQTPWKQPDASLPLKQQKIQEIQQIRQRLLHYLPHNWFGVGRFFGYASAYPAWQQWVHGATEPRRGRPVSVQRTFGSTDASLRAMAYVGFGQNLIASPLRLAHIVSAVANGGWMHFPRLWMGDWKQDAPPAKDQTTLSRPAAQRVIHTADAKQIQQALGMVTNQGTAARPFRALNQSCLQRYGLQLIGKTGTAETRSLRARQLLVQRVLNSGRKHWHGGSKQRWKQKTGCRYRRFWQYDYPEENVADSLFVGSLIPLPSASNAEHFPNPKGWDLRNLAFAVVVKNGYHPEGAPCLVRRNKRLVDLDRSEAKYLAHDIIVALLRHNGVCSDYKDPSSLTPDTPFTQMLRAQQKAQRRKRRSARRRRIRRNKRRRVTRRSRRNRRSRRTRRTRRTRRRTRHRRNRRNRRQRVRRRRR